MANPVLSERHRVAGAAVSSTLGRPVRQALPPDRVNPYDKGIRAMDIEDLEPRKKAPEQRNLERLSIEELRAYIDELKAEIARVEADIARKQSQFAVADSFFKKPD
jgi:uncharacterized small protein (DUF1192 family)